MTERLLVKNNVLDAREAKQAGYGITSDDHEMVKTLRMLRFMGQVRILRRTEDGKREVFAAMQGSEFTTFSPYRQFSNLHLFHSVTTAKLDILENTHYT